MLWVSELPGARWPPCADVRLRWLATRTRHLAFIYIYGLNCLLMSLPNQPTVTQATVRQTWCLKWPRPFLGQSGTRPRSLSLTLMLNPFFSQNRAVFENLDSCLDPCQFIFI